MPFEKAIPHNYFFFHIYFLSFFIGKLPGKDKMSFVFSFNLLSVYGVAELNVNIFSLTTKIVKLTLNSSKFHFFHLMWMNLMMCCFIKQICTPSVINFTIPALKFTQHRWVLQLVYR